jgi:hypothetical protein
MEWRIGMMQPSISGDMYVTVRMIPGPLLMLNDFVKIRQKGTLG